MQFPNLHTIITLPQLFIAGFFNSLHSDVFHIFFVLTTLFPVLACIVQYDTHPYIISCTVIANTIGSSWWDWNHSLLPNKPLTSLHAVGIYTPIGGRASSACWLNVPYFVLHDNPETRWQMERSTNSCGHRGFILRNISFKSRPLVTYTNYEINISLLWTGRNHR